MVLWSNALYVPTICIRFIHNLIITIMLRENYQKRRVFYRSDRVKYQCEKDIFNKYQNRLYKSCIHGLDAYTPLEIKSMSFSKRLQVIQTHKKVQEVLNKWKQEIVSTTVDSFLASIFHHSKSLKRALQYTQDYTDDSVICYHSFRDLGLTKRDIALKLMQENILPKNFMCA